MKDRPRSTESTSGVAPLRRAPAPLRYYDLGQSSIVEWQSGGEDRGDGAARKFYSLPDLEQRLERESALPPALIVLHCGRCGSTLLARLLEIDPANRVFIEPRAVGQFLDLNRSRLASPEVRRDLLVLLRSYGLAPGAGEKRLIFKLNSLSLRALGDLRAALPEADAVYVMRDPAAVVASLARATPAFLGSERRASLAERIGLDPAAVAGDSEERWWSRYLEWNLDFAYEQAHLFTEIVDYRDFATRFLALARRWSDRPLAADDPEVVRVLSFHSKKPGVPFSPAVDALGPAMPGSTAAAYLRWTGRHGVAEREAAGG